MSMNRTPEAPEITTVSDILARMRVGTKEVYELRMREMMFPVRVITMDEQAAVRREAIAHTAKMGGDETDRNCHIQQSTLKLASTITKGGAPLISDSLLAKMSLDEVRYLYDEYIRVMDTVNPSLEMIPPEQFRALVDALKKNTLGARDLSLLQLRAICTAFAELILQLESQASPQGK